MVKKDVFYNDFISTSMKKAKPAAMLGRKATGSVGEQPVALEKKENFDEESLQFVNGRSFCVFSCW